MRLCEDLGMRAACTDAFERFVAREGLEYLYSITANASLSSSSRESSLGLRQDTNKVIIVRKHGFFLPISDAAALLCMEPRGETSVIALRAKNISSFPWKIPSSFPCVWKREKKLTDCNDIYDLGAGSWFC